MMGKRLVPLREYAASLGLSETTIRMRIRAGELSALRLGRYWHIPVEEGNGRPGQGTILTFFTHAGGAGKTSLVRDIGFQLAMEGHRVLLVDADSQSNLTTWLGQRDVSDGETLLTVVDKHVLPTPRQVDIQGIGLDLIPANIHLAIAENRIPNKPMGMLCLRPVLQEVADRYDYILLDSPPSLGPIAGMVALAGHGLVVPVETSAKGIQALQSVLEVSLDYQQTLGSLRFWPIGRRFIRLLVPTKYDSRTRQDRLVSEWLAQAGNVAPVASPLPYRPGPYKEAIDQAVPLQLVADEDLNGILSQLTEKLTLIAQEN